MTRKDINYRLFLYLAAAMLTAAANDVASMRDADIFSWAEFLMKILLSGVITWRAFIDESMSGTRDFEGGKMTPNEVKETIESVGQKGSK